MAAGKFKVESGMQLLARITRKSEIINFYPILFGSGPQPGDLIEIYSDYDVSSLLVDIISEAIMPPQLGGKGFGILIFNTDGHINFQKLIRKIRDKIKLYQKNKSKICLMETKEEECLLHRTMKNLHLLNVFDATQLYTTIYNLESILIDHPNISLIIFDTLTAFYWSEQGFKITKMDAYIKNLLRIIQKVTKEYKVVILYTRPEYFSSSKDMIQSLEPCCQHPTLERLNYRIQLTNNEEGCNQVIVRTFDMQFKKIFQIYDEQLRWIEN